MSSEKIILIDKPLDWTSADVVRLLKRKLRPKKIGHAGTLDPKATGLLIILLDEATKKFAEFQKFPKVYEAEIEFGQKTDTYDSEGKTIFRYQKSFFIDRDRLEKELKLMIGKQKQTPPTFSAVKINGQRAYNLARAGKNFELKSKKIEIYEACLLELQDKLAKVRFSVSSGTYIRSLAYNLGEALGVGAYLKNLRRVVIGEYKITEAQKVDNFKMTDC
ncbi:MAG: tRNA pseudouridine(55) synthase TruB [Candidatus Paceibacterota bacterium]|jgi:tRNA pseudouridine55 synthase